MGPTKCYSVGAGLLLILAVIAVSLGYPHAALALAGGSTLNVFFAAVCRY